MVPVGDMAGAVAADRPPRQERWHLSCKTCGHWKVAHVFREDVAAWLRVHPQPICRQEPEDGAPDRESICPCPCGTPFDAGKVRAAREAQR